MTVLTQSTKAARKIETIKPSIMKADNLAEVVNIIGEDMVKKVFDAQLMVMYRAAVRNRLESTNSETNEFNYTDEQITAQFTADWKPELKARMSDEDKVIKALGGMDPAKVAEILAAFKANQQ